jgi:dolichyl-phosphate beta-glucosyltransferase
VYQISSLQILCLNMPIFLGLGAGIVASVGMVLGVLSLLKRVFLDKLEVEKDTLSQNFTFDSPSSIAKIPAPSLFDRNATKSLSVVIPAYNEHVRLPATLEETMAYLQQRRNTSGPNFTYEVIVVDDGSKDDTTQVAFEFVKKHGVDAVRVLSLPCNKGKGYAVKAGIMCTRGKNVLFMDADGATAVSEIEKLEKSLKTLTDESPAECGLVLGSRAHLQDRAMAKRTAVRNFLMHGFHALVTLVVGNTIRDTQCGFKLMTRKAAQMIVPQQRLQRWAFDVELVKLAQTLDVPMSEQQVVWTEIPGSKVRVTSIAHIAFELALIKLGYDVLGTWCVNGSSSITNKKRI